MRTRSRGIGVATVWVQHQGAVGAHDRLAHQRCVSIDLGHRQAIAIGIAVHAAGVQDHTVGCTHVQRSVLIGGVGIWLRHWWLVGLTHIDSHASGVGRARGVLHRVGEGGRTSETGRGREDQLPTHQGHCAIDHGHRCSTFDNGLPIHPGDGQGIAVRIQVVAQHIDGDRCVQRCIGDVVNGIWRFVDRCDVHRDGRFKLIAQLVSHRIGEIQGAVETWGRREHQHVIGRIS